MTINKELLAKRKEAKENKPDFERPESWRYVRLQTNWRKPKGIDHHQRKQKSRGEVVQVLLKLDMVDLKRQEDCTLQDLQIT
jgi:ribosomal protein L32E